MLVLKKFKLRILITATIVTLLSSLFTCGIHAAFLQTGTVDLSGKVYSFNGSTTVLTASATDGYFYGDSLSGNNKTVYNAMSAWKTVSSKSLSSLKVKLTETITVKLSALPNNPLFSPEDSETFYNAIVKNFRSGWEAFLFDNPSVCWLDTMNLMFSVETTSYTYDPFGKLYTLNIGGMTFQPDLSPSFTNITEAIEYASLLEQAVLDFPVNATDRYGMLREFQYGIAAMTFYDYALAGRFYNTPMGVFLEPGAVCEGYARAFKMLCDRENIPCMLVVGNFEEDIGHMWCYVLMEDNKWYSVDVTWDDTDDYRVVRYTYFLKGSETFFRDHTEGFDYDDSMLVFPILSTKDYSVSSSSSTTTTKATTTTSTNATTTTTQATTTSTNATTTTTQATTTSTNATITTAVSATVSTTVTTAEPEPTVYGDLNGDGEVTIDDVVKLRLYLLDTVKYSLTAQEQANAKVIKGQASIQGNCAVTIQDFVVEKIKILPY